MYQLGLIVFINEYTEPGQLTLQVAPPKRLSPPGPSPLNQTPPPAPQPYSLGNEREIKGKS